MTASNLFALAPWLIFGAGLVAVLYRLGRPGSAKAAGPGDETGRPAAGEPGEVPGESR